MYKILGTFLCYFVCFFSLFVTHFVNNFAATVSYDQKELLDRRTEISHLELDEDFVFNETDAEDILLCQNKPQISQIPVIKRVRRTGCLLRICRQVGKPPLPSVLLANMQ